MRLIKRMLRLMVLLTVLCAVVAGYYATRQLPLPVQPLSFSLTQGSSLTSAARQMRQAGLLPNDWMFVWLARVLQKSTSIKAGNYQLENPVSPLELISIITKGQVMQEKLVIIEGWTFRQLRIALNDSPAIVHDSAELSETEILLRLNVPEKHPEGLFFPDTYYYISGTSDLALLERAYQTMQTHLQKRWEGRAANLPLKTPYEALTLASIVEKETGQVADRSMIAAVFINRLRKGMMLQTDPTVIYGVGQKFDGNLRSRDLQTDTPYNTYTRTGLPPTPIALPGLASLHATLHPESSDALFFVSRGDGSSEFSETLTQHNRAVNRYQK